MTPGGSLHDPRSFETSRGSFFLGAPPTLEGISQLPVDTPHVIQATGLQAAVDCFELASLLSGILSKTTVKLVSFSLGFSVFFLDGDQGLRFRRYSSCGTDALDEESVLLFFEGF